MKKFYALFFLFCSFKGYSQLYQATTETGFRYNPNVSGDSMVIYDDAVMSLPGSSNYSIKITKLDVGIRRLASAPAVDVALYTGRASGDTVPQTIDSLTRVALAANGTTAATVVVSYTNAAGYSFNVNKLNADPTKAAIYVGVRFMGANPTDQNNGWRVTSAPTIGTASPYFYVVNRYTGSLAGPTYLVSSGTMIPCYFYTVITGTFEAALPVDISLFKATNINNNGVLNWTTESESNSSHFDVEVSKDGTTFVNLGSVKASGTSSSTRTYSFTHAKPSAGTYYYRLKMVDKDNSFKYSSVQRLIISGKQIQLVVAPNPVIGQVRFNWVETGSYKYQVLGIQGKQFQVGPVAQGQNSIDISSMKSGVYILDIYNEKGEVVASNKIFKK
jgi:hypothetical protein